MDGHCPGPHGSPHPWCWLGTSPSADVAGFSTTDTDIRCPCITAALARVPRTSGIAACAGAPRSIAACCGAHSAPLPSNGSCRRKTPESAAMERRTKDNGVPGSDSQIRPDEKFVTCILSDSRERPISPSEIPVRSARPTERARRFRWPSVLAMPVPRVGTVRAHLVSVTTFYKSDS